MMTSRSMNKKLIHQVINYFEYLHKENESIIEDEGRAMIESLPKTMKENIIFEMNHKLFYD